MRHTGGLRRPPASPRAGGAPGGGGCDGGIAGQAGGQLLQPAGQRLRSGGQHDHVDIALAGERGHAGRVLRFNDPRRFGSLLWQAPGQTHPLLQGLGPEPLSDAFDGDYLFAMSRGRRAPVKTFLMDQAVVVGVGNIYASEVLFASRIHPATPACAIGPVKARRLFAAIGQVNEWPLRCLGQPAVQQVVDAFSHEAGLNRPRCPGSPWPTWRAPWRRARPVSGGCLSIRRSPVP